MTETPRETRVLDAVVSLVDSLLDDFDVVDLLTELTERCAELLDVAVGRIPARRPARAAPPARGHLRADPRAGAVPAAGRRGSLCGLLFHRPTGLGRRPRGRSRPVAAVRPGRARRRLRLRARRPDARRRHRPGRARPVRHRARRAQRRRSAGRPDPRPHRVRGDPAGAPAHTVDRDAAAALRADQPRPASSRPRASCAKASTSPSRRPSGCCAATRAPTAST